jgi:hypothetical protein
MNAAAAKPAEKVNKSKEVKALLAKGMSNAEIVEALAAKKIEISSQYVSIIKSKEKGGSTTGGKKSGGGEPSLKSVLSVLKEAGGVAEIAKALKTLEGAKEAQTLITKLGGEAAAKELAELLKAAK